MKLGYELNIEQSQKLSLTPELLQSIKILQLNNQELNEEIQIELLENPILESDTSVLQDVVDIDDLRNKMLDINESTVSYKQWDIAQDEKRDYSFEQYVAFRVSLTEHLLVQLHFSSLKGIDAEIGRYIIECIDDNGYLNVSVDDIARTMNVGADSVERVLKTVQTFEPIGVGARNLSECLRIQLTAKGKLTPEIKFIVDSELENLAENKLPEIAKQLKISIHEVQSMADIIRKLSPKPGALYDSKENIRYIVPDIYVRKSEGRYSVSLNDKNIPRLFVGSYYNRLMAEAEDNTELKTYLDDRFSSAVRLIKNIQQRKDTIFKVANAIVELEQEFFERGVTYLNPLTLKQIADIVGIHESTVSRTVNEKYMQCSRGVFELKYFFTSGLISEDGAVVSSSSIKAMIKQIIDGENPQKPYSDTKIAQMLSNEGIDIARRTVAKYRTAMKIKSSSRRRRY